MGRYIYVSKFNIIMGYKIYNYVIYWGLLCDMSAGYNIYREYQWQGYNIIIGIYYICQWDIIILQWE